MHQHGTLPQPYGDGEHNVLELLRGDGASVRDWDVNVDDLRCSLHGLLLAERNDGCDGLRIGTRQLLCIFETTNIEPFPNLCHFSPGLADRRMVLRSPILLTLAPWLILASLEGV